MHVSVFDVALGATFIVVFVLLVGRPSWGRSFPPGPRPVPLLGNLHQMSAEHPWKLFRQWNTTYGTWNFTSSTLSLSSQTTFYTRTSGDIVFLRVFNTPMLVVNSQSAARDLMEKQGTKYSDRPHSTWLLQLYVDSPLLSIL